MIHVVYLIMLLFSVPADPVSVSRERFDAIQSYRATLIARSFGTEERLRYYFKKPGFVRMEMELPFPGVVITYDPERGEVRVRPFAFLSRFVLALSPENRLLRSASGHRVDESDFGALLRDVLQLQENGETVVQGRELILGYQTLKVQVIGRENFSTRHGVYKYIVWIDQATFLPVKVATYDSDHELLEEVTVHDLEVNVEFTEDFFEL